MAEPVSIQTVLTYLTLISVPVGVFYHVLTLWNSQKARQTQILLQLYQSMSNPENQKRFWEFMSMSWDDYDDFMSRYSPDVDQDHAAQRQAFWNQYDGLGLLVKDNVVDLNTVYRTRGGIIINVWFKFETIIKGLRIDEEKEIGDEYMNDFEYLANEMIGIRKRKGLPLPLNQLHPTSTLYEQYAKPQSYI